MRPAGDVIAAFAAPSETVARPGRAILLAGGWVAAAVLFGFFGTRGAEQSQPGHSSLGVLGYGIALVTPVLLLVVWLRPRAVFTVLGALVIVYLARYYPGGPTYLWLIAAAAVLGLREPMRRSLPLVIVDGALMAAAGALHLDGMLPVVAVLVVLAWGLLPVVPWALTSLFRMNRATQRQAAAQHERHRVDEERMRIAREVHDVVGHSLAVISMQAGVALHVADRRPDQARVALEAIARSSRDALTEVRGTLAVFRGEPAPRTPAPGLADLHLLVEDFTATGHPVQLSITGPAGPLPAAHDLAVYRIVQESLTNAARHAGPVATRVVVVRQATSVSVDVCDDGASVRSSSDRTPQHGSGIVGMRERCIGLGGSLRAGPRSPGGWQVHAELPCPAAAS